MREDELTTIVRNVDARLARVEQILPTLPTRDEMNAAIASLATHDEMHAAIAAAVAPLATREEMHREIQGEGERSRHHWTVLFEDLRDDNRIILEHLLALSARVDALARR
jgi:hypothetical protein